MTTLFNRASYQFYNLSNKHLNHYILPLLLYRHTLPLNHSTFSGFVQNFKIHSSEKLVKNLCYSISVNKMQ